MTPTSPAVRPLTPQDLDWVLDVGSHRRERLASFAPRFWRPAPDARQRHAVHLGGQIDDARVLSVRTEHGFAFAVPGARGLEIDDLALDDDARFGADGRALLRHVIAAGTGVRLVCPTPEGERAAVARELGLGLEETWWHRDLPDPADTDARDLHPDPSADAGSPASVPVTGARLVEAPPVYAPGGPVVLAHAVEGVVELRAIERWGSTAGAVVCVVAQRADDARLPEVLEEAGYLRTTEFLRLPPRG